MRFRTTAFRGRMMGQRATRYGILKEVSVFSPPVSWELDTRLYTMLGMGTFGSRNYSESYSFYSPKQVASTPTLSSGTVIAGFYTLRGVPLGVINSGGQRSNFISLSYKIKRGNCYTAKLLLTGAPDFPFADKMIVYVKNGFGQQVFAGETEVVPDTGGLEEEWEIELSGLYTQLKNTPAPDLIPGGVDYGDAVRTMMLSVGTEPYTTIRFNESKCNINTGRYLPLDIEPGKKALSEILDTMAAACKHRWGVDGVGDFFFLPLANPDTDPVKRVLHVGYEVNDFKPKRLSDKIVNDVTIRVQPQRGSGSSGWLPISFAVNDTSVQNYGARHKFFNAPGYFPSEFCDILAPQLLIPEPPVSGNAKNIPIRKADDILTYGIHQIVSAYGVYERNVDLCEDLNNWSIQSSGDLSIALDSTVAMEGLSSVKASFSVATGDTILLMSDFRGNLKNLRIHIRSSVVGEVIKIGTGEYDWDTIEQTPKFGVPNTWMWIDIDISTLRRIQYIGFTVLNDFASPAQINIDKIIYTYEGVKTWDLENFEETYKLNANEFSVDVQFGENEDMIEDMISGAYNLAKTAVDVGEVR